MLVRKGLLDDNDLISQRGLYHLGRQDDVSGQLGEGGRERSAGSILVDGEGRQSVLPAVVHPGRIVRGQARSLSRREAARIQAPEGLKPQLLQRLPGPRVRRAFQRGSPGDDLHRDIGRGQFGGQRPGQCRLPDPVDPEEGDEEAGHAFTPSFADIHRAPYLSTFFSILANASSYSSRTLSALS